MVKFKKILKNRTNQLIFLSLVTVLTYLNILQNGFAFDDSYFFVDWPQIKSQPDLPSYLSLPGLLEGDLPYDHRGVYRPLRSIYYLVSYSIWKENPVGYHLQAIIVHTLVVLVIYLIVEQITKKRLLAFIVALLFSVHPIHTEAITFTSASLDTLGILFFFLAFYFYLKSLQKYKKGIYLIGSLIYAFFGFLTYEMTLMLPFLIILYDFCSINCSFKKLIPKISIYKYFFLELTAYFIIRFVILHIGNRADYLGIAWVISANHGRVALLEILSNYLSWLIWPVKLTISHPAPTGVLLKLLYLLNKIDPTQHLTSLSARFSIFFPIIYLLAILTLIYIFFKKHSLILFSLGWFIISLIPILNILPQGTIQAERFLYIPSFGFCLLLGLLYHRYLSKPFNYKKNNLLILMFTLTLPLLIFFYAQNTITRNRDWKNNKTLWQSAIKTNPQNPLSYGALGYVYAREGNYEESKGLYLKGLELDSTNEKMVADLGLVYEKMGQKDKAENQYKKAIKLNPHYFYAHIYLGNLYQSESEFDKAEEEYKTALKYRNNDYIILTYLADDYYNQQKYNQALNTYKQALSINSYSSILNFKIGRIYFKQAKYDLAIEQFMKALKLDPKMPDLYVSLAQSYKNKGDLQTALRILKQGISQTHDPKLKDELKILGENLN